LQLAIGQDADEKIAKQTTYLASVLPAPERCHHHRPMLTVPEVKFGAVVALL
jgi:hypothetical protein